MQSDPQQKSYRWDIECNPNKYMSNAPGGMLLTPTEKFFIFLFSGWDVVCLCIHWVVQDTNNILS